MKPKAGFVQWLIGFIEGDGAFVVSRDKKKGTVRCSCCIVQRRDNKDVLEAIVAETGLGKVYDYRGYGQDERDGHFKQHPTSKWQVFKLSDCLALADLLRSGQFYSRKKRSDFELWFMALQELGKPVNRRNYPLLDALISAERMLHCFTGNGIQKEVEEILRGGGNHGTA